MTEQIMKNEILQIPGIPKPAAFPMPYQHFHSPALPGKLNADMLLFGVRC